MLLSKEAKCEICLKVISSSANLKTHMILKHAEGDEGNYKCLSCNKGFIRLCDLNNHKQGHNGSQRKLNQHFKCKCSRKFVSIEKLLRHQKIHEEKPFACQSCGFRTSTNSLLDNHVKIHNEELSVECSFCDKKFRHKNSKVQHERVHTGEKPFKCNTCTKAFSQATHLLTHDKNIHSEASEQCKVCEKEFRSSAYLKKHEEFMHSSNARKYGTC